MTRKWWYRPNGHVVKVPGEGDCKSRPLAMFFQVGLCGRSLVVQDVT